MAVKTKAELADKFSGASSLLYQSTKLTISDQGVISGLAPQLDVPVKVDSLNFEQGEPDIEHYKVIGLAGDWVQSAEPGDITLGFRVPTKHTDVLKMAFGNDAVQALTVAEGGDYSDYAGNGVVLKNKKVTGTWVIVNDAEDQLVILNNTSLYASVVLDSDAKGVIAVDFNGSIESDGSTPDIIFLKKTA